MIHYPAQEAKHKSLPHSCANGKRFMTLAYLDQYGVASAKPIAEDLAKRFPGTSRTQKDKPAAPENGQ